MLEEKYVLLIDTKYNDYLFIRRNDENIYNIEKRILNDTRFKLNKNNLLSSTTVQELINLNKYYNTNHRFYTCTFTHVKTPAAILRFLN